MKHNHAAVWTMIVAHQVMGFIWYSPLLFLTPWIEAQGKTIESIDNTNPTPFVFSIMGAILACYGMSWITQKMNSDTKSKAFFLGAILAFGLVFPAIAPHYQFLQISNTVLTIDLLLSVIMTITTTMVLSLWRKKS